jgi:prolyl-tRNA synthetase
MEGLDRSYDAMAGAYKRIFDRCGLDTIVVDADSGAMGGRDSQEFILVADGGEDTIIVCDGCDYSANAEKAIFKVPELPDETPRPTREVHTPGVRTIDELVDFLGISASKTLKAVFYVADGGLVFVVIRGDLDVNEVKLANELGKPPDLHIATPDEVAEAGIVAGSASPVGLSIRTIADESVRTGSNFAAGANRNDYHLQDVNFPRDFEAEIVADIAQAHAGCECRFCGGELTHVRGIEVGHVFKLGTHFSEAFEAYYPDQDGVRHPIIMGCYGIGVGRLLAAAVEHHNDDKGIVFPPAIAPYSVWLTALNVDREEVAKAADSLYQALQAEGIEVLYDDRSESPGVKFNDADLLGLPVRVVVSPRNLSKGVVELKRRSDTDATTSPTDEAVTRIKEMLAA